MRKVWKKTGIIAAIALILALAGATGIQFARANSTPVHYAGKVMVLTYHDIAAKASDYTITPQTFNQEMAALQAEHYHIIPMRQFLAFLAGKAQVPPNAVVLTFDDGYRSFYRYAYPELEKLHAAATDFVIVSAAGKCSQWGLCHMTWGEMKTMSGHGFTFYSHTYNLHDDMPDGRGKMVPELANRIFLKQQGRVETDAEYRRRVLADLAKADDLLSRELGNRTALLCFPHGAYNAELLDLAKQDGIQTFFTGNGGLNLPGTQLIHRVDVGSGRIDVGRMEDKLRQYNQETLYALYYRLVTLGLDVRDHL